MIEFKENVHYIGLWFVPHDSALPPEDQVDFLACAWREDGEETQAIFRFREKTGGPKPSRYDQKSWFEIPSGSASEIDIIHALDRLAQKCATENRTEVDYVDIQGDADKAAKLLMAQPWAHTKEQA